eukprot:jgi/Hompol1/2026/HPOL_005820-RA
MDIPPLDPAVLLTSSAQAQVQQTESINMATAMRLFWEKQMAQVLEQGTEAFKGPTPLPIARIKKVMKTDDEVKDMMISGEAPVVLQKACEIFILELTLRAWIETEHNKRRTLQKSDIAVATTKSDHFDCKDCHLRVDQGGDQSMDIWLTSATVLTLQS